MDFLKNIIQWNYRRGTWQYDVFCLLIIAFIFLTPKTWFEKSQIIATLSAPAAVKALDLAPVTPAAGNESENAGGKSFLKKQ